jgi:truncated hemoglobin YjbI
LKSQNYSFFYVAIITYFDVKHFTMHLGEKNKKKIWNKKGGVQIGNKKRQNSKLGQHLTNKQMTEEQFNEYKFRFILCK